MMEKGNVANGKRISKFGNEKMRRCEPHGQLN